MFCSNCGYPIKENEKFCPECGAPAECPPQPEEEPIPEVSNACEQPEEEPIPEASSVCEQPEGEPIPEDSSACGQPEEAPTPEAASVCEQPEAEPVPETSTIPEQPVPFRPVPTPGQESEQPYEPQPAPKKKSTFWIILSCVMLAAIAAAVLLILRPWNKCGPKTPEEIVRASAEKTYGAESLHADVSMKISVELAASGMRMKMDISNDAEADVQMNPAVSRIVMKMQMLGQEQTALVYTEQDGEVKNTYISTDDGQTWTTSDDLQASVPGLSGDGIPGGFRAENWQMKDVREIGTETVDGVATTVYAGYLPKEQFLENKDMQEELPINLDEGVAEVLDQIGDIPMTFWVDSKTGRLLQYRMDLQELMTKVLDNSSEENMSASGLKINYTVNTAIIECKFSKFNEIPPIVVPPEAKK